MNAVEYLDSLQGSGIRPGLGRIRAILRRLGHPEKAFPSIIVAGTNGKGSTSAMIASILTESGYRTGLYTSPHLVDLRERWTIDGQMIDDATLAASVTALHAAAESTGITPTYFEALTIVAFIAFARAGCELVVLEVGMGGRLDATNVVKPIAAVITPIGLDHTEFLGRTLTKIAREKAGVIHRGAIALTSNDDERVLAVIRRRAAMFGSPLHVVRSEHDTPLSGAYQRRNAALAVATAEALAHQLPKITPATIDRGVQKTQWRGRLQHLQARGKQIWVDGCHNAHAIAAVTPFIEETIPPPRLLVFGIMADKDVAEVASRLFPLFRRIIATEPYPPRSLPASRVAAMAEPFGIEAIVEPDPRAAIDRALGMDEASIFIGGSLYLAGAALEFFE